MTEGEIIPRSPSALPSIHKRNYNESTCTIPKIIDDCDSIVNPTIEPSSVRNSKNFKRVLTH